MAKKEKAAIPTPGLVAPDLRPGHLTWFDEATTLQRAALEAVSGGSEMRMTATEALQRRNDPRRFERRLERELELEITRDVGRGTIIYTAHFLDMSSRHEVSDRDIQHTPAEVMRRDISHRMTMDFSRRIDEALVRQMDQAHARRREVYSRSPARDVYGHIWDEMRGFMDARVSPALNVPLKPWFAHKEFELNGWTAKIIETEEQITAEGELMQHCFARSYRNRVAKEEYIAYHITAPADSGLPKSGFTMGFNTSDKKKFKFDQVKGKKNDVHHCKNSDLLKLVEHIDVTINNGRASMTDNADSVSIMNRALNMMGNVRRPEHVARVNEGA